jgi:hypothetical protein
MLNLSAGEGRDASALGTIHGDWSLLLVEAICTPYKLRASVELPLRYCAGMTTLRQGAGKVDLMAKDGRLRRMRGATS